MIKPIYHKLLWYYHVIKALPYKIKLRRKIIKHFEASEIMLTEEQHKVIEFLKHNTLCTFPYSFVNEFKTKDIEVCFDSKLGLKYVMRNNKRLYFKRNWSNDRVKRAYAMLCCEQHPDSPHCYLNEKFTLNQGSVVADIGSAEGIFALDHIQHIDHVYLFETDPGWVESLNATFAPWKEKVTIVNKYVSDRNEGMHQTIDNYFSNKRVNFIKADVEGAEHRLIDGANEVLSRSDLHKMVITTYHQHNDENELWEKLEQKQFNLSYSNGYMIYTADKNIQAPYIRRGVIRAIKQ